MYKDKKIRKIIKFIINEHLKLSELRDDFLFWKRKNVSLRGIKNLGDENGVYGSFGKGLYTVPLSNKAMAKQYGKVFFVVNGIPKNPKVVDSLNNAEIWRQNLVSDFCEKHNEKYSVKFFEENTTIETEALGLGYDGLIIKGREMVSYVPKNIKYFETEYQLKQYYDNVVLGECLKQKLNESVPAETLRDMSALGVSEYDIDENGYVTL